MTKYLEYSSDDESCLCGSLTDDNTKLIHLANSCWKQLWCNYFTPVSVYV